MGARDPSSWRVVPITAAHAEELTAWRYDPPYERYSLSAVPPSTFLDPISEFVAIVDHDDELVAYRSFGADGQVGGGTYDDSALDTGGGLRPDLTGQGYGRTVIELGLDFGLARFDPPAWRVTIWSSNVRALTVVRSLGFEPVHEFESTTQAEPFTVLVRPGRLDTQ